jgi:hypothetical protein
MRFLALLFKRDDPPLDQQQPIGERLVVAAGKASADQVSGNARDACRKGIGARLSWLISLLANRIEMGFVLSIIKGLNRVCRGDRSRTQPDSLLDTQSFASKARATQAHTIVALIKELRSSPAEESQSADITVDPMIAPDQISFKQCVLFGSPDRRSPPMLRSTRKYSAPSKRRYCTPITHFAC